MIPLMVCVQGFAMIRLSWTMISPTNSCNRSHAFALEISSETCSWVMSETASTEDAFARRAISPVHHLRAGAAEAGSANPMRHPEWALA